MALTKVSGDFIKAGSVTQAHLHSSHGITTSHLTEGDKLFFTNARVDSRIGSLSSSDLSEGTNLYYTDARARAAISGTGSLSYNSTTGVMSFTMPAQNTSNITEGSNLYYTDARADARIAAADTGDLSEGTNLYYTDARADARITASDTDSLSEGSTNLYYTDARADARVALIVDSAPGTLNTLNELAAALGDDANFSTTVTNSIALKAPLASPSFTGVVTIPGAISAGANGGLRIHSGGTKFFNVTAANAARDGVMDIGASDARFKDLYLSGTIAASGYNDSNWNTAYGWGDHGSGGYAADSAVMKLTGDQTISGTKTFDNASIVISGTHGTISFMDTTSGEDNFYLHTNSNNFYVLADRDATDAIDGGYDSPHPLQLEGDTNTAYVFGSALNIGNWNTAYGWGDHGAAGYLTSFDITTQTDSKYLRSNANDTATHRVIFSGCETNNHDTIATGTGSLGSIEIYNDGANNDAFMTFHTGSDFALYFGLDAGTNKLSVGGWSMGAVSYEIYHAGNLPSLATLGYTGATNANYITNNNQLTNGAGYLTSLPSHTHDDRYYTESEIQQFFNRGYLSNHSASNLAAGWYTIATNTGDRALGEFQIWDTASSDHQSVLFSASHHFGMDTSNDITVLANSRYSGTNFRHIRIKEGGTYDGAALQVYIDGASNTVYAAIVGGNAQESGWVLKDWIADGTDPGDLSSYNSMTQRTIVDLDNTQNGGIITTGPIYSGGQTTQYRVLNTSDEGSGNGLDADTLDGQHASAFQAAGSYAPAGGNYGTDWYGNALYHDEWVRNHTNNNGHYWSSTGWHLYPRNSEFFYLRSGLTSSTGLAMTCSNETPMGYVYANSSSNIGLLNNAGQWSLQCDNSKNVTAHGSSRAPIFYDSNDTGKFVDPSGGQLRFTSAAWSGEFAGKIQYHSAHWYLQAAGHVRFRNASGSNTFYVDQGGTGAVANYLTGGNSLRAPLFYDSNNTGYYVDPASKSFLSTIHFNGSVSGAGAGSEIGRNHAYDTMEIKGYGAELMIGAQHAEININYRTCNGGASSHTPTTWKWRAGSSSNWSNHYMGLIQSSSSMRAPIFYDSNNTSYYVDPHSTSVIVGLTMAGALQTAGSHTVGSGGTSNIYMGGTSGNYFRFHCTSGTTYFDMNSGNINWRQGSSTRFIFYSTTANMTVYGTVTQHSDLRIKDNVVEIPNCIDKVKSIRGIYYNRTDFNTEPTKIGVVAQEVEVEMPELVHDEETSGIKSVSYTELTAVLVNAIKEQQTIIDDLKTRLETLENQ